MNEDMTVVGKVTVTQETDVTRQMVNDILCTAFEGGINYWCNSVSVEEWPEEAEYASHALGFGAVVILHGAGDDENYRLTLDMFLEGLSRAASHYGMSIESFYNNHDAEYADLVVQFALFDTVVYG